MECFRLLTALNAKQDRMALQLQQVFTVVDALRQQAQVLELPAENPIALPCHTSDDLENLQEALTSEEIMKNMVSNLLFSRRTYRQNNRPHTPNTLYVRQLEGVTMRLYI